MAYELSLRNLTLPAARDLSGAQYSFLAIQSDGTVDTVSAAGGAANGVLQNKPGAAGRATTVGYQGITKMVAGGAIADGAPVMSDANGHAVTFDAGTGHKQLGTAVMAAASGDIFSVLLQLAE